MNIAIFADIHGRLLLCFKLCARWQRETGEKIDLILQTGDMGIFPDPQRLDRATRLHAERDPSELGFMHDFLSYKPEVDALLKQLSCNMVFVRGNHEDQEWLDNLEQAVDTAIFPIDYYKKIFCLKTGYIYTYETQNQKIDILGIGRIGYSSRKADKISPGLIQPYEQAALAKLGKAAKPDVLLSHDIAAGIGNTPRWRSSAEPGYNLFPGGGMAEVRETLDRYKPAYHFFGHVGKTFLQFHDLNNVTESTKLADLVWEESSNWRVPARSMGILRWENEAEHSFKIVEEEWLQSYSIHNWQYLD